MKFIAISGMMGSGKTTLAKQLARQLTWTYAPESQRGVTYLVDLFENPKRWAFDAQIAFLTDKAIAINKLLDQGVSIILDRTLEEDFHIFAEHFYETGSIDLRSYETYKSIYYYFKGKIPSPDIRIHCYAPLSTITDRLKSRRREFDKLYPDNHIQKIFSRYENWNATENEIPSIEVDTLNNDFRIRENTAKVLELISHEIERLAPTQTQLFNENSLEKPNILRGRKGRFLPRNPLSPPKDTQNISHPSYPYAYFAAPFTIAATSLSKKVNTEIDELFPPETLHGEISRGWYRKHLLASVSEIEKHGFNVLLPHRDINAWGKKILQPHEVYQQCTQQVHECDMFIGILGGSPGSHLEYGIASALQIPSIIIHCRQLSPSYISLGINQSQCLVLSCEAMHEVPKLLRSKEVLRLIDKIIGA